MSQINKSNQTINVITIRIDHDLSNHLDEMKRRLGMSKADLVRNYLDLSRYIIKQKSVIKSLNNRDFIVIKRTYLRKIIETLDEVDQIQLGDKLGRFINDLARIVGDVENINYKLDICENLGFFPKFVDNNNYVLITKKFGPTKFVEAFVLRLFKQKEYNSKYIDDQINSSKSLPNQYKADMGNKYEEPLKISSSHYSFEIAKITEEE